MLVFDLSKEGLGCIFKPYQAEIMRHFWRTGKSQSSRPVHDHLHSLGGDVALSRASVTNFLNYMVDEGLLDYVEEPGKGGYRRIYSLKYETEQGFRDEIYMRFHNKLLAFKNGG